MKTHVIIVNGALSGQVGIIQKQDKNEFTINMIAGGGSFKFGRMDYLIATPHQIIDAYARNSKTFYSKLLDNDILVQKFDTTYLTMSNNNLVLSDAFTHETITEI